MGMMGCDGNVRDVWEDTPLGDGRIFFGNVCDYKGRCFEITGVAVIIEAEPTDGGFEH